MIDIKSIEPSGWRRFVWLSQKHKAEVSFLWVAWESLDWQSLMKHTMIRPQHWRLMHSLPLTMAQCWSADKTTTLLLFFSPRKKIRRRRRGTETEREEEWWYNSLCAYLLVHESIWLFLYKKARLSYRVSIYHFHLELARSALIASHWFVRGVGWMKGMTAEQYVEYNSYYTRPMAMALIIGGDLLYARLRAHKHPGPGRCIWSLFYVDFLHH